MLALKLDLAMCFPSLDYDPDEHTVDVCDVGATARTRPRTDRATGRKLCINFILAEYRGVVHKRRQHVQKVCLPGEGQLGNIRPHILTAGLRGRARPSGDHRHGA